MSAMPSYVLDASAILAMLDREPGADTVAAQIEDAVLSSVNAAEVVTRLVRAGFAPSRATAIVEGLPCPTVSVDGRIGCRAGELYAATSRAGLSLGDRVCLALAEHLGAAALTSDQAWANLALPIGVTLIR
jgi:ribonuclease VapC